MNKDTINTSSMKTIIKMVLRDELKDKFSAMVQELNSRSSHTKDLAKKKRYLILPCLTLSIEDQG